MNTWMWPVDDDWYYRAFSGFMGGPFGRFLIKRFDFFVNGVMKVATGDKSKLSGTVHLDITAGEGSPRVIGTIKKHLSFTVALVGDLGGPVAEASVSSLLEHESGSSWTFSGTTGSEGMVTFSLSPRICRTGGNVI